MSVPAEESLDQYTATSPREIAFNLRQLVQAGEQITVSFDEGRNSFLSMLLDIDEDLGLIYFDWSAAADINRQVLASPRNVFVCSPGGIRNQFVVGKTWQVDIGKRPAFAARLPDRYLRLQRREFFRLGVPLSLRLQCAFNGPGERRVVMPASDIGIGGIGLTHAPPKLEMAAGIVLNGGQIDLGQSFGIIRSDLELRYTALVQHGEKSSFRYGFRFASLSSGQEVSLQKFLTHVQREIKARGV